MDHPLSPSSTPTIEEKLAKLCVRPHLSSDVLPRFVLTMLECALHSFLCSFAACVMELIEKYRRGELEPWPDVEADVEAGPCVSQSKLTSAPVAPRSRPGAKHVQKAPDAWMEAMDETSEARMPAEAGGAWLHPAYPRRGGTAPRHPQLQLLGSKVLPARDRCRPEMVWCAAETRRENCA